MAGEPCERCDAVAAGGRIRVGTRSQALWLRGTLRSSRGLITANRALVIETGGTKVEVKVWDQRLKEIDQLIDDLDRVIDEMGWHDGQPQRAHT